MTLAIVPGKWSPQIARWLLPACANQAGVDELRDGVKARAMALYVVKDGRRAVAAVVVKPIIECGCKDLWVEAFGGRARVDLTEFLDKALRAIVARLALDGARFQTRRAGLVRKAKRLGWREVATVMRWAA